jgi:hypothetical protein
MYVVNKLVCLFRGHSYYNRQYPFRGLTVQVCGRCGDLHVVTV